jgi:putative tryptophan/tyrosine transport system substrate-binding protein
VKRRALLLSIGATASLAALHVAPGFAQPARQPRRVAVLTVANEMTFESSLRALHDGMRQHGIVEGSDVVVNVRYGNGRAQDLPRLAAELAALDPVVIVATGTQATDAALAADARVPIVSIGDLVAAGHATQLGRPSGRVTGVSFLPAPLNSKRLELLAELLPRGSSVMNLADPRPLAGTIAAVDVAGRTLGLTLHTVYAGSAAEIDTAFVTARKLRVAGVNVLNSPFLSAEHARIVLLAANARLPTIYQWPETAREGGLIGYGPSLTAMFRQLGGIAARIVGGASPGDLPIEQPVRFELVINLKTARALGITIPPVLRARADELIS